MNIRKNIMLLFAVGIFVLLDQITKYIAVNNLKNNNSVTFINKIIDFSYMENKGAAWGIFAGKIGIFVIIVIVIVPILIYIFNKIEYLKNTPGINKGKLILTQILIAVIISGAVGNFIDRIVNGYVVDFIQFKFISFPVFNIADCYITVGTVVLGIIYIFFMSDEELEKITPKRRNKNGNK